MGWKFCFDEVLCNTIESELGRGSCSSALRQSLASLPGAPLPAPLCPSPHGVKLRRLLWLLSSGRGQGPDNARPLRSGSEAAPLGHFLRPPAARPAPPTAAARPAPPPRLGRCPNRRQEDGGAHPAQPAGNRPGPPG